MPDGAGLVHAGRQGALLGDDVGTLRAQKHASGAGLGSLPDHDLDCVGRFEMVGVKTVPAGQQLVDEEMRCVSLIEQHAAISGGGRDAQPGGSLPERDFRGLGERAVGHARDGYRAVEDDRLAGVSRPEDRSRLAALAIAFKRNSRERAGYKRQVVEARHSAVGRETLQAVATELSLELDVLDDRRRPDRRGRHLMSVVLDRLVADEWAHSACLHSSGSLVEKFHSRWPLSTFRNLIAPASRPKGRSVSASIALSSAVSGCSSASAPSDSTGPAT